ncbi:glycosyltransferase family A protein [Nitrosopumilus sp. b2]|uniref:glycosyltransferase family A protein n=1 Tax=Nitrosopumilus sp. b2 TaxID=2109908 RepID=UPI0015F59766|nr:glycosyltransferase family A protein [Nitrosopumilus sp. b2]KAF6245815.1 hypothetical protein C6989_01400 [Nitrosopumilus sp. b2]
MADYYCFFPVRDGEKTINDVMNSLFEQTLPPKKIIVTEDGSTDKTSEILEEFEKDFPDILKVIHTGNKTRDFRRIPKLWNMCLTKECDYHMIGAGDCIFESNYAEKIIKKMEENPKLVICSGDFGEKKSKTPHGAGRFVRQSFFFSNYDEYPEIIGYESEIINRALMQNFKTKIFHDAYFEHVDKLGHSHNFSEFGQGMKALGYHPLYVMARCFLAFVGRGNINRKGALNMFWKYVTYRPEKSGYYSQFPKKTRDEIKNHQWKMIKNYFTKRLQ